jgi:alkylation response protein AidB-like acyl-CoA dehydrogenase
MSDIQAILAENEKLSREMLRANADSTDQSRRFPRENLQALGKAGVLGLMIPTQYGGAGAGLAEISQVLEEQAQNCASTAMVTLMHFCATAVIAAKGCDAPKQENLRRFSRDDSRRRMGIRQARRPGADFSRRAGCSGHGAIQRCSERVHRESQSGAAAFLEGKSDS